MFKSLRAALLVARSLKRIADALEEQNRVQKIVLLELNNIVIPDPAKKWTKQEREIEVVYGEQATKEDDQETEEWNEK